MQTRHQNALALVKRLLSQDGQNAVIADGWPPAMVRDGFELHRQTWDIDAIMAEIARESVPTASLPRSVAHLWPALPGAGITPMLYSYLAGIQDVRFKASRRGRHFGEFVDATGIPGLRAGPFHDTDLVVVSGADETIAVVQAMAAGRVVGYGHKVSFSIVDATTDPAAHARDVVMWRQQGCFSLRGIIFIGTAQETQSFCAALATQISHYEEAWEVEFTEPELQQRVQTLGVAEFSAEVYLARNGFVELTHDKIDGVWRAPLVVQVRQVDSVQEVHKAVGVPRANVQGISTNLPIVQLAKELGATRVCRPGDLQAPEANWQHDGFPNIGILVG